MHREPKLSLRNKQQTNKIKNSLLSLAEIRAIYFSDSAVSFHQLSVYNYVYSIPAVVADSSSKAVAAAAAD